MGKMKKLKLNEPMAKEFFSGFFGGLYTREMIEQQVDAMNNHKVPEMTMECGFFDKKTMDCEENDVEIVITCTLRKIGYNRQKTRQQREGGYDR
jgi:hypothetical protein